MQRKMVRTACIISHKVAHIAARRKGPRRGEDADVKLARCAPPCLTVVLYFPAKGAVAKHHMRSDRYTDRCLHLPLKLTGCVTSPLGVQGVISSYRISQEFATPATVPETLWIDELVTALRVLHMYILLSSCMVVMLR